MTPIETVRKKILPSILKPYGYLNIGKFWIKKMDKDIVFIISYENSIVQSDNFLFSMSYGVYFNGIDELLYNNEFTIKKKGLVSCIIKDSMNPNRKPSSFSFNMDSKMEDFQTFIETNIKEQAIPFLEGFTTSEQICSFMEDQVQKFLKSDSIVLLKLACIYYLTGSKGKATNLIKLIIEDSKKPYPFAEKLLKKIEY